ncbi:transposase [Pseudotabrizicola algicola]|uniref:Transposase n=1 Tax=Pseudotabrizicola algicola TaxID=2709381 RepID=A0A6B3RQF8_9RHOB|nr:transposase [Pseudotabrizicola algicola]NEX47731.1 transposase [Pseudotabrizicola algicola]
MALDHCPPALRDRLDALLPVVQSPFQTPVKCHVEDWQFEEQKARLRIIQPILEAPKGTAERAERFRIVAATLQAIRSQTVKIPESTLRDWVKAFEERGLVGLLPDQRSDRGQLRVIVTREWDAAIDLPEKACRGISEKLVKFARSLIANDGTAIREVLRLASKELCRLSLEAESKLLVRDLQPLCGLNTKWAERHDLDSYYLIYWKKKDNKKFQDKVPPRVRRGLHPVPMGLLIGDVHYVDILVEEAGEPVRVRLIGWLDASSMFLWVTPVFLSKGKGVIQADVAESLAQVTMCPHGGIPQEYYLDNGGEYSALAGAMQRLSVVAEIDHKVTLAKPYSPTGKGGIEGLFNIFEGILKGLPGWIGGDRTNKKTVNKGKVVEPYRKGLAQLEQDIRDAVAIYNSRPQSAGSRLAGLSPKQMLEAKIKATGFHPRNPDAETFDLIFSQSDTRMVRQGCINVDGRQHHSNCLDGLLPGDTVEVFTPLRKDRGYVFVRTPKKKDIVRIDLLPIFADGNRDGARLQGQLEAGVNRAIRDLSRDIDPNLSTFEAQKAAADMTPPMAPSPDIWTRAIDKTNRPISETDLEEQEDARKRRLLDDLFPRSGDQTSREASDGNR